MIPEKKSDLLKAVIGETSILAPTRNICLEMSNTIAILQYDKEDVYLSKGNETTGFLVSTSMSGTHVFTQAQLRYRHHVHEKLATRIEKVPHSRALNSYADLSRPKNSETVLQG